jgi:signal transduction histidine kinase
MTRITRVLLVEDDPADHLLILKLLGRANPSSHRLDLKHVSCLQGALDRLGKGDVDAVLLDLNLPDSGGVGTVTTLREHEPEIPVVVFTAAGDDETAIEALKAGAQDYLVKGELTAALVRRSICYAIERCRMASESRRLRSLLLEAERRESLCVFGAGAAFGLNQLAGEILEHVDLVLDAVSTGEREGALHGLSSVRKMGFRISKLAEQLRDYAIPRQPSVIPTDLSVLVAEMSSFLEAIVPKRISFAYDLARCMPQTLADQFKLRRLLTNFVVNASEAIGDREGHIAVATGELHASREMLVEAEGGAVLEPGSYLFLRVTDDGRYIEPHMRKRLFDPFYTTKFVGRGLGLSAALGIARQHGGVIYVTSNRGKDTSFTLLLPPTPDLVEREAGRPARF